MTLGLKNGFAQDDIMPGELFRARSANGDECQFGHDPRL